MALMKTRRNNEPPNKKDSKISIKGAKTENVFYADIKDPIARKKAAQETENPNYEQKIKSGKYVPLSSLDPTSQRLWSKSIGRGSEVYGKVKNYAIPVEKSRVTSYEDIYGKGNKFNPEEFEAASKSGKVGEYVSKFGVGNKVEYGGVRYETEADIKQEKEEDIKKLKEELKDVKLPKMEIKKPSAISAKTTGGLKMSKRESEQPTWVNPSRPLVSVESKFTSVSGKDKTRNVVSKAVENVKRKVKYAKEEKQFKSYYGAPSSISGSDRSGMTASDVAKERESLKGVKKELRADIKKGSPIASKSELRAELKNVKKDIRSTGKAQKYAAGNIESRSVYDTGKEVTITQAKKDGSARFFKPELGEQYSAYSKSIKSSTDNAVNQNKTFGRKVKLADKKN